MDFGERHPEIDSVVSVVDKPIQWVMGGIQVVLGLLFVIGCCIFLPIYGYLRGHANRADAVAYFPLPENIVNASALGALRRRRRKTIYVKDQTHIFAIDYTRPMVTAQYTQNDIVHEDHPGLLCV